MINEIFVYFLLLHSFTVHPEVKRVKNSLVMARQERTEFHRRATNLYLKNKALNKKLANLKGKLNQLVNSLVE